MNDKDKIIIDNYQQNEKMMILVFAQWCVNNDLDPLEVYYKAYPHQQQNKVLEEMTEQTVAKEEADFIATETVLQALQLFGNDDLAFTVQEEAENFIKRSHK
ncbi:MULTISPECIES: hypothetical protein [Virgibacillus]|uniref:YxiS n=1 Tax=Virgibacillus pantothenticus TaxID=1473 RepID=A0A0L0QSY5_VIRPA|nr:MULTISPECIES: hypothetical protein [Virgibacillus]API91711.1 hypothetical protein BKP57_07640 [Virgibacillus sp. 6R]KNE21642.1 hypothetical protein AFK71_08380 [Virgibacillus pantothenticus]MBS7427825.1 hypothetical protein [Virgibacillus sp. 19R1-5]MBU8568628.1 hypothetical protein [Virgibacillus pantothenticus]MBU8602628.1 hypothetical protein [Virgibacillus pantothenticus]